MENLCISSPGTHEDCCTSPREATGTLPVMLWDHGTGGHAYNAVARASYGDDFQSVAPAAQWPS